MSPKSKTLLNFTPKSPFGARPVDASTAIESALRAFHLKGQFEQYSQFPFWQEIVGSELASVAIPERITRGRVLVVRVVDAVWSQELALRKGELLDKLQQLSTGALIEDIRFVTGDPRKIGSGR